MSRSYSHIDLCEGDTFYHLPHLLINSLLVGAEYDHKLSSTGAEAVYEVSVP